MANFGTVISYGSQIAVGLFTTGQVTNGGATDTTALIDGGTVGVLVDGANGVVTTSTIVADLGTGGTSGPGEGRKCDQRLGHRRQGATLSGSYGMFAASTAAATFTNFGTVHGFGGAAVYFGNAADVLNVEAGSVFQGSIAGVGGWVLNLASGTGTLSNLSGGAVTVSGSMAKTTFRGRRPGDRRRASFTDKGAVSVTAGDTINDAGTLSLGGAGVNSIVNTGLIESTGTLTLAGAVANAGTLYAAAGTLTVVGAETVAGDHRQGRGRLRRDVLRNVAFAAGYYLGTSRRDQIYAGLVAGFSKTGATALDLGDIASPAG